jgi:Phage-related lysozyme (muraminidase)
MMIRLESQMFNQLSESLRASDSDGAVSGLSFSDLLNSALGGSTLETDTSASGGIPAASALSAGPYGLYGAASPSAALSGAPDVSSDTASVAGGMAVSDNMVKFIERHEGFSSTGYRGVDSWNVTTGYGHVVKPGENIGPLTPAGAETLLRSDLTGCEASVNKEFAGCALTQGQFDALTGFAMGLGTNIWSETPKLVSDIKSGAPDDVIESDFRNCSKCGGQVVQGLVNRREAEFRVFAYGDYSA